MPRHRGSRRVGASSAAVWAYLVRQVRTDSVSEQYLLITHSYPYPQWSGRIACNSASVSERDARSLLALAEDVPLKTKLIVCGEPSPRRLDCGVEVVPVTEFLDRLWGDAYA
jgi:hypothetical protein